MGRTDGTGDRTLRQALKEAPWGVRVEALALFLGSALVVGVLVGMGIIVALRASEFLQDVVWTDLRGALPAWLRTVFPLVICALGGILVGLASDAAGFQLYGMGEVVRRCKQDGGYSFPSWGWAVVLFALPIAFGGAVGPEAGVSGFVAAVLTLCLRAFRRVGEAVTKSPSTPARASVHAVLDSTGVTQFRLKARWARVVMWIVAVIGILAGAALVSLLLPGSSGFPRVGAIDYANAPWVSVLPAFVLGVLVALLAGVAGKAARRLSGRLSGLAKDHKLGSRGGHVLRSVVCGAVLGLVAIFLPEVLFSGQTALGRLVDAWASWSVPVLLLTVVAKLALTQLCINMDWVGGEFFPLMYCGAAAGYVVALAMGCDPLLPAAVSAGALVATATKRPALSAAILAICFPVQSLPVVLVSAFAAAAVRKRIDASL